ncbi:tRNA epoxyqueuosine(34) reductase QueG [Bdellovibrio svalbardensis]|uniref:tRNA epoxyqueuosine(34) reductase QueG n=1 Tax=Bdellovibrio svalbardensis TaxID=2972972 RepID=A0ABT6DMX4_9BACT|nr:tRNA epoxyqueuosine(34) reductase QueG [Bdellovibrio svalbardensis]MDG0818230.1 tRNA epoxyqueuosine(34) reductase QueG [Bdellovibrio svalbardensis]
MTALITKLIKDELPELGFSHFGFSALSKPLSFEFYQGWLNEGLHGDMKYLEDHAPIKETPQAKWPRAQSALVFAIPYFPHPEGKADFPLKAARVSLYAQGMDYHFWFRERMQKLCTSLQEKFPDEEFLSFTDSSPILERDLAKRAGLGWVGKNTCLIHPKKGSLFFIGEIYTSLKMTTEFEPVPDFCGTCTRCIDICPTGALLEPRKMDARKCISYLTIESRTLPPEELREKIGDWFFGCDLCQTVCPWNQKVFKGQLSIETNLTLNEEQTQSLTEDLRYILSASGKKLEKDFWGTPLARAGSFGLKKNALIVAGNKKLLPLKEEVQKLTHHEKLGPLALWTLKKLASVEPEKS